MKKNIISLISSIEDFVLRSQKGNRNSKKIKRKTNFHRFLQILTVTTLIILAKEPITNLLIISGDYRKPHSEEGIFYTYRTKIMLASQIVNQKILIVAGSGGLFGLDAQQIESSTGVPTVNLAVHAGLGVDYILAQVKRLLKPGDIVLLPLEYEIYQDSKDDQIAEPVLRNYIISYDHDYLNELSLIDRLKVILYPTGINLEDIDRVKAILKNKSPFDKNLVYSKILEKYKTRDCYTGMTLDSNGDEMCNIGKPPIKDLTKLGRVYFKPQASIDASGSIRDFCQFAKKHKITIVPLYPSTLLFPDYYTSDEYKTNFASIKKFWLEQGIPFEDTLSDSFLEEEMMFNTYYHANDKGRNLRTKNVIKVLNKMNSHLRFF